MSTNKRIDKICMLIVAAALLITVIFCSGERFGLAKANTSPAYATRLFDPAKVHTIDILMDDWDEFLTTCKNEEYSPCTVLIDNQAYTNVGIRAKGNTSLSQVESYGSSRYSFKIEFDHYDSSKTYYGLDQLCLNNIIQDNTYMKDFLVYQMMASAGVASPLCSYAQINVNGEEWGLYLAIESVQDSFLSRNYGNENGDLYKPDSTSMGGGRGNGKEFDMNKMMNQDDSFDQPPVSEDEKENGSADTDAESDSDSQDTEQPQTITGATSSSPSENENDPADGMQDRPVPPDMPSGMNQQMPPEMPGGGDGAEGMNPQMPPEMPDGMQMPPGMPGQTGSNTEDTTDDAAQDPAENNLSEDAASNESDSTSEQSRVPQRPDGMKQGMPGGMGGQGAMGSDDTLLKYIDEDPESYSNIFDSAKTDVSDVDKTRLIQSLKNLSEGTSLDSALNLDKVIAYFVVHNFVLNFDSYTGSMIHNYYLYENDGQMQMIPWDYNLAFGGFQDAGGAQNLVNYPIDSPVSGGDASDRPMLAWIFNDAQYIELYHQYFAEFLSEWFENGEFERFIDQTEEMIAPYVQSDPTKFCTYEEFKTAVSTLREFCLLRAESIEAQLNGTIGSTSDTQDPSTLIETGDMEISDMGEMHIGGEGRGDGTDRQPFEQRQNTDNRNTDNQTAADEPEGESTGSIEDSLTSPSPSTPEQAAGNATDPGFSEESGNMPSMPGETDSAPVADPAQNRDPMQGNGMSFNGDMRTPDGDKPGDLPSQHYADKNAWIMTGVCSAVLGIALVFVCRFKRRR